MNDYLNATSETIYERKTLDRIIRDSYAKEIVSRHTQRKHDSMI